ncbi:glycosyltransferase family 2 protein [Frigoribacterium sp. CG_9.8]|uniref:glycosyltransferase family 2 protein n=1 Tax=Frigoribacterium sp. CG_9.8 TaxID=2787733 RepID=UPI0018C97769|nr:glycosyltransferase family 2 protein [Frigoribacterium sp. CG_9.8]MBG6106758.1 GT2 family glycosyltransferase [Frigoribacterium sp. CG_9.8]
MSRNPVAAEVKASIIIVAWRLVDELQECLDDVAASIDAPSHEVIVVLNGSRPETSRIAHEHPVVSKVIERFANIGFGAACNLAARSAVGTNLIFLNDDARVDRHWLAILVDAASTNHGKSAIASLLLNFDGTVQEAGSRLLSHGGTVQWGSGLTRAEAERDGLLAAREVDYGSAAALLVKRADFEWVGGFDPIFEPAYFEDVDLQLRLRERGIQIWLEPHAIVLHHSGQSTQNDRWFRQFAANRSGYRFIERWGDVLSSAPAADDPPRELSPVPVQRREVIRDGSLSEGDDSPFVALTIAHDYETWLSNQLDQLREFHVEISADPDAPTRRELIDRLHDSKMRVHELTVRLSDVENRGPFGTMKMWVGTRLNALTRSRLYRSVRRLD